MASVLTGGAGNSRRVGLRQATASCALVLGLLPAPSFGGAEAGDGRAGVTEAPAAGSSDPSVLVEDLRGSYSIIRSAAPPALIAQGRGAVRPLFDLLWVKPQGDEVAMLLHFFDHGALVEACLAIMADYREDPAVRLKAGLFTRQLVGQEAIRGELKDLYRDLYKDPSSPDGVRVYAGNLLDSMNEGRPDLSTASSVEYRFREPRSPSPRGISTYFLTTKTLEVMFTTLGTPESTLASHLTGFLLGIDVLKMTKGPVMQQIRPLLLKASLNPAPRCRAVAAAFLPFFTDPEAIKALVALADDSEAVVRSEAARSLALVPDQPAVEKLRQLEARREGSTAIAPETAAATQAQAETPGEVGRDASTHAPEEITVILRRLASEGSAVALEGQIRALAPIGPAAVDLLVPYLSDSDVDLRVGAAIALGGLGDPRAVRALVAVVTGPSLELTGDAQPFRFHPPGVSGARGDRSKIAAIRALGKLRAKECLVDLQRLFTPETEQSLLVPLAVAIAEIDEDAVDSICTAAYDGNPTLRTAAVAGLSMLEGRAARKCVMGLLEDRLAAHQELGLAILASQVRRKAIDAGRPDEDLFEILAEGISPEDPCNVIMASSILATLGWTKPFLDALEAKDLQAIERHYPIFIMLAAPGSEELLAEALGQSDSADVYLVCKYSSNRVLMQAAAEWARESRHARAIEGTEGLKCIARWGQTEAAPPPSFNVRAR